jgi:hypothetical protein
VYQRGKLKCIKEVRLKIIYSIKEENFKCIKEVNLLMCIKEVRLNCTGYR